MVQLESNMNKRTYYVNMKNIAESHMPATIRELARICMESGYLDVGASLRKFNDQELEVFCQAADDVTSASSTKENTQMLLTLSLVLATGEGMVDVDDSNMEDLLRYTITFLYIEQFKRAGLVEIDYKGMTYGETTLPLVKLVDKKGE